jgi:predicted component of type VI protein secretion system
MRPVSIRIGRPGQPFPAPLRFRQGVVVIGRSRECDVQLEEPAVSRRHCRLLVEGDRVLVEDLGSRHGTRVDGVPLAPGVAQPLADGAVLHVEEFLLEVSLLPAERPAGASARPPGLTARSRPLPPSRRVPAAAARAHPIPVLHPVRELPTPPPQGAASAAPRPPPATGPLAAAALSWPPAPPARPAAAAPFDDDLVSQLGPEFLQRVERDAPAIAATLDALSRASSS